MPDHTDSFDSTDDNNVTRLLNAWQGGDQNAFERLYRVVNAELDRIARACLSGEGGGATLQTRGVINEAYLRLAGADLDLNNRQHFFSLAARMMRRILVDHARARQRQKRGGSAQQVTFDEAAYVDANAAETLIEVEEALVRLAEQEPRMAEAVELVYFGGLSYEEAAGALEVSRSTLHADLRFAKAWLKNALDPAD